MTLSTSCVKQWPVVSPSHSGSGRASSVPHSWARSLSIDTSPGQKSRVTGFGTPSPTKPRPPVRTAPHFRLQLGPAHSCRTSGASKEGSLPRGVELLGPGTYAAASASSLPESRTASLKTFVPNFNISSGWWGRKNALAGQGAGPGPRGPPRGKPVSGCCSSCPHASLCACAQLPAA